MSIVRGDSFAEFSETFDNGNSVPYLDVVRLVNDQMALINESLGVRSRITDFQRRQTVVYLLEQCIFLCSGMIPSTTASSRRRFRRIRRVVERARRLAHGA
jgi:hypothetical protein